MGTGPSPLVKHASRLPPYTAVELLGVEGITSLKDSLTEILKRVSPRFVLLVSVFSFRSFFFTGFNFK